jgi:ABC-type anion transport system duplicated permease subunit
MAATPVLLRVVPPQIDLSENSQPKALIAQSPQQVRCVQYPSTSFSQSNAVFNIIPVSSDIILARYILLTFPMTITIQSRVKNGQTPAYAFNSQFAGLCQFPLHQIMATLTLGFNNASITIRPLQIFPALLQYLIDREQQKSSMSTTPCYPDQTNT